MKKFSNTITISKNQERLLWVNDAILQVKAIENYSLQFSLFTPISDSCDKGKDYFKECSFSHRDNFRQWHPKNQRTELCNLLNGNYY